MSENVRRGEAAAERAYDAFQQSVPLASEKYPLWNFLSDEDKERWRGVVIAAQTETPREFLYPTAKEIEAGRRAYVAFMQGAKPNPVNSWDQMREGARIDWIMAAKAVLEMPAVTTEKGKARRGNPCASECAMRPLEALIFALKNWADEDDEEFTDSDLIIAVGEYLEADETEGLDARLAEEAAKGISAEAAETLRQWAGEAELKAQSLTFKRNKRKFMRRAKAWRLAADMLEGKELI